MSQSTSSSPNSINTMLCAALPVSTEEGNKIIALFMGWNNSGTYGWLRPTEKDHNGSFHRTNSYLLFHSSWDWLMPVVEKIEKMNYLFTIEKIHCTIEDANREFDVIIMEKGVSKINCIWLAVIQFLNWYNENKPVSKR